MSWTPVQASVRTWSGQSATDLSRQFLTVGNIDQGGQTNFVLSVDENHPIILSELTPYVLLQEVMVTP